MKKFVIIDGVKYLADANDETKAAVDDKGEKILWVEPKEDTPPKKASSLEDRAKEDPDIARLLAEKQQLEADKAERERIADEERQEALRKNGEFEKLANEERIKREEAVRERDEHRNVLKNYKAVVSDIRDELLNQIPEDKRSLVPTDNAKNQIEYIRKNAKFLGVSLLTKAGSDVPPNQDTPPLDETAKLRKEFSDLMSKENLTPTESNRLNELSVLIKQLNNKKD